MTAGDSAPGPRGTSGRAPRALLLLATVASFLLVIQNFCLDVLPDRRVPVPAEAMTVYPGGKSFAYVFAYGGSEPDRWPSPRSRVRFYEGGHPYRRLHSPDEVVLVGGDRFTHEPGRIVFASTDNTDPRTNGRDYYLRAPVLYRGWLGDVALVVLAACVGAWWRSGPKGGAGARAPAPRERWGWHLAGASALFLLGMYCNTGSLAPYAVTTSPHIVAATGYAYNPDHRHFRVLFDFVDGREKAVWDHALLLRRILFPVLGWPLMKLLGFEIGGTLTSLGLNLGAFAWAMVLLRRSLGFRAAAFCCWILALYPGAAYWAGLPYGYALIFPSSLLLTVGLIRMADGASGLALVGISLGMGVAYLGYDLPAFFVPASLIVLCRGRRYAAALLSLALQAAPLAAWLWLLRHRFAQELETTNSGIYHVVLLSYLHPAGIARWLAQASLVPAVAADVFFASNFLFLPALFLFAFVANPATSRVRFSVAEAALLACGLGLFLAINLAPGGIAGWAMDGTWISRLYQPVFPALAIFSARWWAGLPALSPGPRAAMVAAVSAACIANALVLFGPILRDPLGLSQEAFYRFYDHTDAHFVYRDNLDALGRRPIGFPRAQPPPPAPPTADEAAKAAQAELASLRFSLEANRTALLQNQRAYRDTGRALAEAKAGLHNAKVQLRLAKGEIKPGEAERLSKAWNDFVPPALRALIEGPALDSAGAPPQGVESWDSKRLAEGIASETSAIVATQGSILAAQRELGETQLALTEARLELGRVQPR